MNLKFNHFLITRINLGYKERILNKNIDEQKWLNYRFDLFFKTCFPSVVNQNCQNFTWLIYLDFRTPDFFVNQLQTKISSNQNFKILLRNGGFESLTTHAPEDIKNLIDKDCPYIITSRIDSDDLIHREYIDEVQSKFDFQKYLSINFTFGLVHDLRTGLLGKSKNRSNPFISLIEKIESNIPIKTVCFQSHTDFLFEEKRLEITSKKRLWCMNMHAVNDSTKFAGLPVFFFPPGLVSDFSFKFINKASLSEKISYSIKYFKRQSKKIPKLILKKIKSNG
ncbi:glycosyltransferase [Cognataquiflexum aquatile]|uniref:glycosyltransferase n=1 Tax=Cognataquiflexum aquatile TaxID=2249427 RepID=UPI000DE962A8|nr:glycosyltransferase [Cognataquiflexum aquatile]